MTDRSEGGSGAEGVGRGPTLRRGHRAWWGATAGLVIAHASVVWLAMGGWSDIASPWPLAMHDHPTYFHSAWVTPRFLAISGTTAGYDPFFMAGYPKSIVFPASSTLWEVIFALRGRLDPAATYKIGVFAFVSLLPAIVAAAGAGLGVGRGATAAGTGFFLIYLWSDFPINYAQFGMVPYQLAIPLGLLATACLARYLADGGTGRWARATTAAGAVALVHFTSVQVVGPAVVAALVALVATRRGGEDRRVGRRVVGLAGVGAVVAAANAFWWWPGPLLAGTKGASDFVFSETGPVLERLGRIWGGEPIIQPTLIVAGSIGLIVQFRRDPVAGAALAGFAAAGFGWGYLAQASRALDFLQAGRHTYALYSALAVGAGVAASAVVGLAGRWGRIARGVVAMGLVAAVGVGFRGPMERVVGPIVRSPYPRLSSRPTPQFRWLIDRIGHHFRPGERILYEEGGFGIPGLVEPFGERRYSGLLPYFTGVEVVGGPYLHAALGTNHTQFGEGKLLGKAGWTEDDFRRGAATIRPAGIVAWTPKARGFCRDHPGLIEVVEDDGRMTIGRVVGYGGATIRGEATVRAEPGRLVVTPTRGGELDGLVVLRYHFVPCLRGRRSAPPVPVMVGDDPVPFIGLRPTGREEVIEMGFGPR